MSTTHESALKLAKKAVAKDITEKLQSSQSLVVAEYRGLTVAEMNQLRVLAKKNGIELKVYKNRVFKFAAEAANYVEINDHLVGPNIFAFSNNDALAGFKVLADFAKNNKLLVLKAGIFEGNVVDAKGVQEIATLPNYEEALGILGRSLIAPLQQLSLSLKLLSEKKEEVSE